MDTKFIIIIFLAVFAAVLGAVTIWLWYTVVDFQETAEEQEEIIDKISKEGIEHLKENTRLTLENAENYEKLSAASEKIGILEAENKHLNDLLDQALAELESVPEQKEPTPESGKEAALSVIPKIDWTFDRLPEGFTNTFRCEDWHKIDDLTSEHYHLQQICLTDMETGIRFFEKNGKQYLCAALATAYGITIGNGFEVTLENGEVFNVIHADYKHDITKARADDFGDPDINYLGQRTTNVIEFVYDEKVAPDIVNQRGGMFIPRFGDLYGIGGDIVKISYKGRVWEP